MPMKRVFYIIAVEFELSLRILMPSTIHFLMIVLRNTTPAVIARGIPVIIE